MKSEEIQRRVDEWRSKNVTGHVLSPEQRREIDDLHDQLRAAQLEDAKDWEAATPRMTGEMVQIPKEAFEELLLHFEGGHDRDQHLIDAWDAQNAARLECVRLCFDR